MTGGRAPGPGRKRRGFILVTVLVTLLALTALSMAALALAMAEHRGAEWERRWVTGDALPGGEAPPLEVAELGGGFRVEAPAGVPVPLHRVSWCLDPGLLASGPWGPVGGAVGAEPQAPWPAPLPDPRLGPLGVEEAFEALEAAGPPGAPELPGLHLEGAGPGDPPPLLRVGVGANGALLLLAGGDLRVERREGATDPAPASPDPELDPYLDPSPDPNVEPNPAATPWDFRGVLLVEGALHLGAGVQVRGGARARGPGGGLEAGAGFHLDPVAVEEALRALPRCPAPLGHFGRLGRYPLP